jgi:actin-like ATPase involved in cell morphogenesis
VPYSLGVDLGTTASAAAIGRDGAIEVCALGDNSPSIPSVVVVRADGTILVGDAAARRAREVPTAVAREFKRRFGDPTPYLLGDRSLTADQLTHELLTAIVARVRAEQQEEPAVLALAHPADYGPFKLDLLRRVASDVTTGQVVLVPEPVAAAMKHASESRIEPGALLAVYDFGGGTFDAAVVRRSADGFDVVGVPGGLSHLGGLDIDAAVIAHVDTTLDGALSALDDGDPAALIALHRVRAECCAAKEHLSHDTDATLDLALPGGDQSVRITRGELEDLVRPMIEQTVAVLEATIVASGVATTDLEAVLLVGGSSRIPLVGQLVAARTGRPTLVDPYPKLAVAFGAGVVGLATLSPAIASEPDVIDVIAPPVTAELPLAGSVPPDHRRRRLLPILVAALVLLSGAGLAAWLLAGGDGDPDGVATGPSSTTSSSSTSSTTTTPTTTSTTTTTARPVVPPPTAPTTQATTPPPVIPIPRDLQVGGAGGSGELSVTWLADGPPVDSYQSYLACGSAGNTAQTHRTVANVEDVSIAPEGRRGFIDFGVCNFGTACYSVAARDANGTEGPRTTPVCGTP